MLVVALTGGLYALAGFGKAGNLPANIGPFLGVIFALLLVAHLAMRKLAPLADPMLLPSAGLLNGIGYVFIARLSTHEARLQAVWTGRRGGVFRRHPARREDERVTWSATGTRWPSSASVCSCCPCYRESARTSTAPACGSTSDRINFQPGELAKLALAIFFASVHGRAGRPAESRSPGGSAGSSSSTPATWRPSSSRGVSRCSSSWPRTTSGSSFLFFALFIGMLWVATGRAYYLGLGAGLFAVGSFSRPEGDRPRPITGPVLAQPVGPRRRPPATRSSRDRSPSPPGGCSVRARARATPATSPRRRPT